MTIEQTEKGTKLLDELNVWEARYRHWINNKLSCVIIGRHSHSDIRFDGAGNDLSVGFFNEVQLKYGELCKKQIELLTKQIESL